MTISASDVKKLREMTGAGMMDCKEALGEAGGDFSGAVDFLRKKGLAKAAKKADRETKEGLIQSRVAADMSSAALVQVSCETDFVARTPEFVAFVDELANQLAAASSIDGVHGGDVIGGAPFIGDASKTVDEILAEKIAKLGENMTIARVARFATGHGIVQTYIHPGSRVGVLVELRCDRAAAGPGTPISTLGRDLGMQVAAAGARFVRREEVDASMLDKEREIAREQLRESGKPEAVIEKIVEGKMGKFYEEVCLLEQEFIKEAGKKVQDVVREVGATAKQDLAVVRFARFVIGE